jgi:ankyrin repeat protein
MSYIKNDVISGLSYSKFVNLPYFALENIMNFCDYHTRKNLLCTGRFMFEKLGFKNITCSLEKENQTNALNCCLINELQRYKIIPSNIVSLIQLGADGNMMCINSSISNMINLNSLNSLIKYDCTFTALHFFCINNDLYSAKKLLDMNMMNINIKTINVGRTPLINACCNSNLELVKLLLSKGADPNIQDTYFNTPLIYVCNDYENDNTKNIVKMLIESGSNLDIQDYYGKTALMLSVEYGNYDICKMLIESGSNINICDLEKRSSLMIACEYFHENIIQLLLENGANPDLSTDDGKTALLFVTEKESEEMVSLILSYSRNKKELINKHYEENRNPLTMSQFHQKNNILKIFIDNGADVNVKNIYGFTPLIQACLQRDLEIVLKLIQTGVDINMKSDSGLNSLMTASINGNEDIVKTLIDKHADVYTINDFGYTPLMFAVENNNEKVVELLLPFSENINEQNDDKYTALMFACINKNKNIIKMLLNSGVNPDLKNKYGETALMILCENGKNYDVVNELLKVKHIIDLKDFDSKTALYKAFKNEDYKICRLLLEHGADPNIKYDEETILMKCCEYEDEVFVNFVNLFITMRADLNIKDNNGNTALMVAIENKNEKIIKMLINSGADLNIQNNEGFTVLMYSLDIELDYVKFILKKGSNINLQDNSGNTVLMYCCMYYDILLDDIINILLEKGVNLKLKNKKNKTLQMIVRENGNKNLIKLFEKFHLEI